MTIEEDARRKDHATIDEPEPTMNYSSTALRDTGIG